MKNHFAICASVAFVALAASPAFAGDKKKDVIVVPASITQSGAPDANIRALNWQDGKRQEMAGLMQAEKARENVKDSQKDLRKAEEKNTKQLTKTTKARADYVALVAATGKATTPEAASEEIKRLSKAVDNWSDEAKDLARTKSRVEEVKLAIATAQSNMRTGTELTETGREKMLIAEGRLMPVVTDVSVEDIILDDLN